MRTHEAAAEIGISVPTLRRWLKQERVPAPNRDRKGWREFTKGDIARLTKLFKQLHPNNAHTK